MIREVNFRDDILFGVAHLLGIDPTLDLLNDHARAWVASINRHVRRAYKFWAWPEVNLTEERAFRQVWRSTTQYRVVGEDDERDEVYYIETESYYQVNGAVDPPIGTLPTDGTFWAPIEIVDRYVAYEQPGKQAIGKVLAVHATTPRTMQGAATWDYRPDGKGIFMGPAQGPTVWITYQPREPVFTVTPFELGAAYERHDLVNDLASGNCYRCLVSNTGDVLLSDSWLEQVMPYVIAEYVKLATAADVCDDQNTRLDLAVQARRALEDEADRLIEQGEIHFWNIRGPARLGLGLKDFYWSVAAPQLTGPGYGD